MGTISRSLLYSITTAFLLLSLLSPRSQKARFYLNTIVYITSLGVCSTFGVVCSILLTIIPGANRLNTNYYVARSFYLLAGTLTGVRFKVEGEENFAKARPAVLVGNHMSAMDILYLGRIFPRRASIMAKQELKYAPLLGQFSECWLGSGVLRVELSVVGVNYICQRRPSRCCKLHMLGMRGLSRLALLPV